MFKYSHRFLEELAGESIDYKDFDKNWLDLQGFEVASEEEKGDDTIIELEVKANRPDMLSHLGVLREYYVYKKYAGEPKLESEIDIDNKPALPIEVEIKTDKVGNLVLVEVKNIDNTKKTPEKIVRLLNNLGVASVNAVVDIANYIMLELGQPIHIYDKDKLNGKLEFATLSDNAKITTLNGAEVEAPKGSIIINDRDGAVCLAGIIGTKKVEIDENTKNIIIESANFDAVKLRIASQKTHISTLASYRYERGVDANMTKIGAKKCAESIIKICGGEVASSFVKYEPSAQNAKKLRVSEVNNLLGTFLTGEDIKSLLEKYYYTIQLQNSDEFIAYAPSYRLDIEQNIDVIGDIAQIYGYHNIAPTMPNLSVEYEPNAYIINTQNLRQLMQSQNINECISYSFIHENAMKMMQIAPESELYGDIAIINPLSNKFAIMRPNMLYSMLNTMTYNYAKEGECAPIFEFGTVFKRDNTADTGYSQSQHLAVILSGEKISKGFGIDKAMKYDFYDIKQVLELISTEYSADFELEEWQSSPFEFVAKIKEAGECKGLIGKIDNNIIKNFENGKLVKGGVYYMELNIDGLEMGVTQLEPQSKYPSIEREYNLLVRDGVQYADIEKSLRAGRDLVKRVEVQDIYQGKGVAEGWKSLLLQVEYNKADETLTAEEVEKIETEWLKDIEAKYNVTLKM